MTDYSTDVFTKTCTDEITHVRMHRELSFHVLDGSEAWQRIKDGSPVYFRLQGEHESALIFSQADCTVGGNEKGDIILHLKLPAVWENLTAWYMVDGGANAQ